MEKGIKQFGKIFFLSTGVMASAAMLTGCGEEVAALAGGSGDGTRVEVTASFQPLENAALTRAADGLDDAANGFSLMTSENGASKVRVMVDENDGSYAAFDYGITGPTAIEAPDPAPAFPRGENSVNVYGWYPAKSLGGFSVAGDQSGKANYCLSDLLWANSDTSTRVGTTVNKSAALNFAHVMSKVKVVLALAEGVTVKAVKLKNVKPTVTVSATTSGNTVTGYTTSSLAGTAGDITLLSGGSLTSASAAADLTLCGVFPPQTISDALLAVTATYNGGSDQTITYSLASGKAFDTNKEYTISISLNPTDITTGTLTLADWDSVSGSVTVKTDAPAPTLSADNLTLTYGDTPGSITASGVGSAWSALSENTSVATVSGTGPITVTPAGVGATTIHVWPTAGITSNFSTASCAVTVNPLELQQDDSSENGYVTIDDIADQSFTGSAVTPTPVVKVKVNGGEDELVPGTDFTCTYSNNIEEGTNTATVTIVPKAGGKYVNAVGDAITKNFSIIACSGSPLSAAAVGMIICEHGKVHTPTLVPLEDLACGGKKVAVVAYVGDAGTADYSEGSEGYHGLAIALYDATGSEGCIWYTEEAGAPCVDIQNNPTTIYNTPDVYGKGIYNTNKLAGGCEGDHVHDAATAAKNYKYDTDVTEGAHPASTSQWFLPTFYQWNLIVKTMCEYNVDLANIARVELQSDAFNTKIIAAGGYGVLASDYWSSTQSANSYAYCVRFGAGTWRNVKVTGNTMSHTLVRSVLAF